jgi:hypothetical protein
LFARRDEISSSRLFILQHVKSNLNGF